MKKLVLALASAGFLASTASANIGTGFYIGAHTGWDSVRADYTIDSTKGKNEIGRDNPNIGVFAGYGWLCGCFYWGGEIGYTFANIKIRQSLGSSTNFAELKRSGYFNVAARFGYLFSQNTMGYIRLGGSYTKWKATDTYARAVVGAAASTLTGSKNRFSFVPGVGIETALNRNVRLRAEWGYEFGSSLRAESKTAGVTTVSNFRSIRGNSFKLGVLYTF
jgi:opacity protein-like surface antigen